MAIYHECMREVFMAAYRFWPRWSWESAEAGHNAAYHALRVVRLEQRTMRPKGA